MREKKTPIKRENSTTYSALNKRLKKTTFSLKNKKDADMPSILKHLLEDSTTALDFTGHQLSQLHLDTLIRISHPEKITPLSPDLHIQLSSAVLRFAKETHRTAVYDLNENLFKDIIQFLHLFFGNILMLDKLDDINHLVTVSSILNETGSFVDDVDANIIKLVSFDKNKAIEYWYKEPLLFLKPSLVYAQYNKNIREHFLSRTLQATAYLTDIDIKKILFLFDIDSIEYNVTSFDELNIQSALKTFKQMAISGKEIPTFFLIFNLNENHWITTIVEILPETKQFTLEYQDSLNSGYEIAHCIILEKYINKIFENYTKKTDIFTTKPTIEPPRYTEDYTKKTDFLAVTLQKTLYTCGDHALRFIAAYLKRTRNNNTDAVNKILSCDNDISRRKVVYQLLLSSVSYSMEEINSTVFKDTNEVVFIENKNESQKKTYIIKSEYLEKYLNTLFPTLSPITMPKTEKIRLDTLAEILPLGLTDHPIQQPQERIPTSTVDTSPEEFFLNDDDFLTLPFQQSSDNASSQPPYAVTTMQGRTEVIIDQLMTEEETQKLIEILKNKSYPINFEMENIEILEQETQQLNNTINMLLNNTMLAKIESLSFTSTKLSAANIHQLIKAMHGNHSIKYLFLSASQIPEACVKNLSQFIKTNTTIEKMAIFNNDFTDEGYKTLEEALKENKGIYWFRLYETNQKQIALDDYLKPREILRKIYTSIQYFLKETSIESLDQYYDSRGELDKTIAKYKSFFSEEDKQKISEKLIQLDEHINDILLSDTLSFTN